MSGICNPFRRSSVSSGMGRDPSETFRDYLRSLPEDLLESVTGDYVWLAGLTLEEPGYRGTDFRQRRECCREECVRRGSPQLYEIAGDVVSPHAA